jgi:hypothetical protein
MSNVTDEALLVQLGYTQTNGVKENLKQIIKNTHGYESIKRHILSLQKALEPYGSFIAISSSKNFFKIKNESRSKEAYDIISKWAQKYKVAITKAENKEAYYINGKIETA